MGIMYNCRRKLVVAAGCQVHERKKAVQLLVDIVAKGGNLLLNIAPGPQGQWHDGAYILLEDIGRWMKINSEAIYGTRALAPYKEGKVCISKKGDNTIYIYYMAEEEEKMPAQDWNVDIFIAGKCKNKDDLGQILFLNGQRQTRVFQF